MVSLLGRIRGKKGPKDDPEEEPSRSRSVAPPRKKRKSGGSAPARAPAEDEPRRPAPAAERDRAGPAAINRLARPSAAGRSERSPPVRTKVPETPPDPGVVRADQCFVCGSTLEGAFCPECEMRWVE